MLKTILMYSLALAGLALGLQFIEYRHQVRLMPTEAYVVIIAVLFAGLGVWAGRRLTSGGTRESFQRNQQALDYLGITERETEVLELLAEGCSNQQMAERLFVSSNTIKTHLKHLYEKLDVSRRTQAVRKARELRLIP